MTINLKTLKLALFGLLLILAGSSGCARVNHHTSFGGKPISLTATLDREYLPQEHFRDSQRAVFLLFHLIPLNRANAIEAAESHLVDRDGIVNLRWRTNFNWADGLVSLLTVGLINTWHIELEGDTIRFANAGVPAPAEAPTTIITPAGPPQ